MHAEMRSLACRALSCLAIVLFLFILAGAVSAAESVTTLADRTVTVNGTMVKKTDAKIRFAIDDFQGFRQLNLSYEIRDPATGSFSPCGITFLLTTDEYLATKKGGAGLTYVRLSPDAAVYKTGSISFDPRVNSGDPGQNGNYVILMNIKPENCVAETRVRLDLVREGEGVPATPTQSVEAMTPGAGTTVGGPPGTTPAVPSMTVQEPVATPGTLQEAVAAGTTAPVPTKPPLPGYLPVLAVIFAFLLVLGGRRDRR